MNREPSNQSAAAPPPGIARRMLHLNARRVLLAVVVFVAAAVAHNFLSALLGVEEPVFFSIAVIVVPLYLLVGFIYTMVAD